MTEIDFVEAGEDLGPSGLRNRTYEILPQAQDVDYDDSNWRLLAPAETQLRLGGGSVCFSWYRINVTIPQHVGRFDPTGATVVFEVGVAGDAEVWVDGSLSPAMGQTGGQALGGFNTAHRAVLGQDVRPGQRFQIAVFGTNGPLSASTASHWMRSATLDLYAPDRARAAWEAPLEIDRTDPGIDAIIPSDVRLERVAGGFEFTEGPVWTRDGALLFSSPNTNTIYRWAPTGTVRVFRTKSGYAGADVGRFAQPGSNGMTFDPDGLLTICQHGNRRVVRIEADGDITVLADRFDGRRLNSPNDLVYRSDGTLYFTDPPYGLPEVFDDPQRELPWSGVYRVRDGEVALVDDELAGPNGIALSPDERHLYVGNWILQRRIVKRYDVEEDGAVSGGAVFFDMTAEPTRDTNDGIDGIKVDRDGNLYVCGPSGIWLLSADGEHLGTLMLPEDPHNLAWGDADGRTLYVTALTSIYRLRLNIPGVRPQ